MKKYILFEVLVVLSIIVLSMTATYMVALFIMALKTGDAAYCGKALIFIILLIPEAFAVEEFRERATIQAKIHREKADSPSSIANIKYAPSLYMPWTCEVCGNNEGLMMSCYTVIKDVKKEIRRHHKILSPKCEGNPEINQEQAINTYVQNALSKEKGEE